MQDLRRCLVLILALSCVAAAQPAISAVLNGASYNAFVSPGCWVAIFGTNLALSAASAQAVPLPTNLGGVSVTVGGKDAPLLYVSATQINALIPLDVVIPASTFAAPVELGFEPTPHFAVPLIVKSSGGSITYPIRLTRDAPGLFTRNANGIGRALIFNSNFQNVDTVADQDVVILYAAGLGPTDSSGRVVDTPEVYIGERRAQVMFAGLAPGFPGIYQLNLKSAAPATDRIYIRSGAWQSNIADIGIRVGANTANVTGTIDGLNPSSDPNYPTKPQRPCIGDDDPGPCGPTGQSEASSIILHAGTFTVSFDIVPSATPFDVAAVGEGGGSIISINPASGTYIASVGTVTTQATNGNFSSSGVRVWDYASCDWRTAECSPFPNNVVPSSRLTPFWLGAIRMLPLPNTTEPGNPDALLQVSGQLNGSHFIVDGQNHTELANFGGFVQAPYGPFASRVSTFKLYVDGKLIASKDLPYLVYQRAPSALAPDF